MLEHLKLPRPATGSIFEQAITSIVIVWSWQYRSSKEFEVAIGVHSKNHPRAESTPPHPDDVFFNVDSTPAATMRSNPSAFEPLIAKDAGPT
jgi:hypothetical protein